MTAIDQSAEPAFQVGPAKPNDSTALCQFMLDNYYATLDEGGAPAIESGASLASSAGLKRLPNQSLSSYTWQLYLARRALEASQAM